MPLREQARDHGAAFPAEVGEVEALEVASEDLEATKTREK